MAPRRLGQDALALLPIFGMAWQRVPAEERAEVADHNGAGRRQAGDAVVCGATSTQRLSNMCTDCQVYCCGISNQGNAA